MKWKIILRKRELMAILDAYLVIVESMICLGIMVCDCMPVFRNTCQWQGHNPFLKYSADFGPE
jgi:hypothetical protein